MVDVIIGNGTRAELPKAKTAGEAAAAIAQERGIEGGTFTLKINGNELAPSDSLKVTDSDVVELVEHVGNTIHGVGSAILDVAPDEDAPTP